MPSPLFYAPPIIIETLSTIGTVLVMIMCAAQLPTFRLIALRRLDQSKVSFLPTLGQLANFSTWTVYGIFGAHNQTVVLVNVLGIAFCCIYIILFLFFAPPSRRILIAQQLGAFSAVFFSLESAILFGVHDLATRQTTLAYVSIACNVVMYGAPIGAMRTALAKMDPTVIPILLVISSLACSGCWCMYGLLIGDYNIAAPNVAGAVLCLAQIAVALRVRVGSQGLNRQRDSEDEDNEDGSLLLIGEEMDNSKSTGSLNVT
jgi:hypothetical protein